MIENKSKKTNSIKGGVRPGSGRKKGSPNKKTAELQRAVAESGLTPLEYLLEVMRNSSDERQRLNAAIAAAPYIHPKLANIEVSGKGGGPVVVAMSPIDELL